jgi:TatA/E family protein of Tat protein translocase
MGIGIWQIVIAGLVIALLFGSHRLPALAAEAARGLKSLKREAAKAEPPSADAPFDEREANPKR